MTGNQFMDIYGYPNFPGIKFRGNAKQTTPFGIDNTFGVLRIHNGRDRDTGDVYCPLPCEVVYIASNNNKWNYDVESSGYGSILIMRPKECDFEIRVMHMAKEDFLPEIWSDIQNGELHQGCKIGKAGCLGIGTGNHTHMETVSISERSAILESILKRKYPIAWGENYTLNQLQDRWAALGEYGKFPAAKYIAEKERRRVKLLNDHICIRKDYLDGYQNTRTFYNSEVLAI